MIEQIMISSAYDLMWLVEPEAFPDNTHYKCIMLGQDSVF